MQCDVYSLMRWLSINFVRAGCRGEPMSSSDELEFLKTFDGDEEMINRHFITVEIPRSGSRAFRKQSPLDMKRKRLDMKRKNRVSVVEPTLNVFQELELENQSAKALSGYAVSGRSWPGMVPTLLKILKKR